jgi:hypothetical protein
MCATEAKLTTGAHHVGLSVIDVEEARSFFVIRWATRRSAACQIIRRISSPTAPRC